MGSSLRLQRMVSRVGGRLVPPLLLLSLATACGGDRGAGSSADSSAVASAGTDTAPAVSAPDTVAAVTPDTSRKTSGATDSTPAKSQPGTAVTRSSGQTGAADTGAATRPAAKPATPKPQSKPAAPKPAAKPADTAAAPAQAPAAAPAQDAPLRDAYHQAPRDTVSQAVYDGWKQYNLNCARCHGEDVMGTTIAPHLIVSLKPDGPINTKELFVQTVCAGRPAKGMPAWCALGMDPAKINQIYAYVKGRSAGKIGPGRPAVKQGG